MSFEPSDFGGLFSAQRIAVVGANGAGKTRLALRLGAARHLPVIHNDALALTAGWVQRDRADVRRTRDILAAEERWVIEGGPSILCGAVLAGADLIVWLDLPRGLRLRRVLWRSLRYLGQQRPEHPVGNRDWPGRRQMRFALKTWTRDAAMRRSISSALDGASVSALRLTSVAEVARLETACDAARQGTEAL